MAETRADVCIVGAGLAGLVAARDIVASARSAVVLEARDRVGGRVVSHDIGEGKVVEMGGQWIGPTQDRMYALAKDLGIETFPMYFTGTSVAVLEGKRYRFRGEMPRGTARRRPSGSPARARLASRPVSPGQGSGASAAK